MQALKEIKTCEKQINRLIEKATDASTQEELFAIHKQIREYKQMMLHQAKVLQNQIINNLEQEKAYYINYATSTHQKQMKEYLTANPDL